MLLDEIIELLRNAIDLYDDSDDDQKEYIIKQYDKEMLFNLSLAAQTLHNITEEV